MSPLLLMPAYLTCLQVIYAQTCYGDRGVTRLFEILRAEFHSGMRLLGANKISDLKPEMLELLPHKGALFGEQLKS